MAELVIWASIACFMIFGLMYLMEIDECEIVGIWGFILAFIGIILGLAGI